MSDPMQDLWQNDTAPVRGAEEILARTERLKTIIRQRTLREFSGAIVVVLFFAAAALLAATAFARLAAALIAGLTLCIALVSRFRAEQRYADPTLASIQYGRDALSAYSEQIERLSRLRHWYSVPAIIGLTFLAANAFADKNATAIVILQLAAMAIAFGLAWVLDLSLVKEIETERSLFSRLAQKEASDMHGAVVGPETR
jgi:hypothetical protein